MMQPQKIATSSNQPNNVMQKMGKVGVDSKMAHDSSQRMMMKVLADKYPGIPYEENKRVAKEIALAEQGAQVKVEGKNVDVGELRTKVADAVHEDLAYRIAFSIESINSETDSENEYYRMIEDAHEVIKRMNDGEITLDDDKMRTDFLSNMDQREVELMRCLALYNASATPEAKNKAQFISLKLNKLRELRSSVLATTKANSVTEKTQKNEYEKAHNYWIVLKSIEKAHQHPGTMTDEEYREKLRKLLGMENLSEAEKVRLGVGSYSSLQKDFVSKEARDVFMEMQLEAIGAENSPSEFFIVGKKRNITELLRKHRGLESVEDTLEKQAANRERLRQLHGRTGHAFDSERFQKLRESERLS